MSCPISGFQDPDFAAANRVKGQDKKPAEDPRAMIALARVNWLHAHYKIVRLNASLRQLRPSDSFVLCSQMKIICIHSVFSSCNRLYVQQSRTSCIDILIPVQVWARKYGWRKLSPLEEDSFFVLWAEIGRRMNIQNIPDSLAELQDWSKVFQCCFHSILPISDHGVHAPAIRSLAYGPCTIQL
jgi:hypothetical protein